VERPVPPPIATTRRPAERVGFAVLRLTGLKRGFRV
jgi:hypothetical protein